MPEDSINELFHDYLKDFGVKQIEVAISNALGELTGMEYKVTIAELKFEPAGRAAEVAEIHLTASRSRFDISEVLKTDKESDK
jgi:hypothetical protein